MAMDVGAGKGGPKSDINVTPLVDVMLVLLIIMMLIAPMLQKGVDVRLPLADNTVDKPETQEQTVVAVDAQKRYYVGVKQVSKDDLISEVNRVLENKKEKTVIIKADRAVEYGAVMEAMDSLRMGGIEDMGLITGQPAKRAE